MRSRGRNTCCVSKNARKHGWFRRKSDSQKIKRFCCNVCGATFSSATNQPTFGQNKRQINYKVQYFLASGVSMRRCAKLLNVSYPTIVKKLAFMGKMAQQKLGNMNLNHVKSVQFDELQTIEHTKLKPLSIAIAVADDSRKILGFRVAKMPATGHLAKASLKKYGQRPNERINQLRSLFKDLCNKLPENSCIKSDECSFYKRVVNDALPMANYTQYKGGLSHVYGQGELKKVGRDPLFSINHTLAMCRANINRLFRRTWCTTKKNDGLIHHLSIYALMHNQCLTPPHHQPILN